MVLLIVAQGRIFILVFSALVGRKTSHSRARARYQVAASFSALSIARKARSFPEATCTYDKTLPLALFCPPPPHRLLWSHQLRLERRRRSRARVARRIRPRASPHSSFAWGRKHRSWFKTRGGSHGGGSCVRSSYAIPRWRRRFLRRGTPRHECRLSWGTRCVIPPPPPSREKACHFRNLQPSFLRTKFLSRCYFQRLFRFGVNIFTAVSTY